jgi:hypothetical protein
MRRNRISLIAVMVLALSFVVVGRTTVTVLATTQEINPATQELTAQVGVAMTPSAVYTDTLLPGVKTFTISPDLPAGLTISSTTGVISGTPVATLNRMEFTVICTDDDIRVTATVFLRIVAAVATITPATQTVTATVGTAITATAAYNDTELGNKTFTVSPALPAGLSLNSATGVISGTPSAASATTSYTVTATDGTLSATATVSITVSAPTTTTVTTTTTTTTTTTLPPKRVITCKKGKITAVLTGKKARCPAGYRRVPNRG